jgi:hypothetical protein
MRAGYEEDGFHGMGVRLGRTTGALGSIASGSGAAVGSITKVGTISVNATRASVVSTSGFNVVRPPAVASVRTSYVSSNVPRLDRELVAEM